MKFPTILIADDDTDLLKILAKAFTEKDFYVHTADNGKEALVQYNACKPNVILMDVDMPEETGWEVLEQIRKENTHIPIIIMSGHRTQEEDAIKSLKDGAISFIRKTSSYKEIVASVESITRSIYSMDEIFTFGEYTLNMKSSFLRIGDKEYDLTDRETQLLCLFVKNRDRTVKKREILNLVWSNDSASNYQMMRNTITKLNKIFETNGKVSIQSKYGSGYRLKFQE